MNLILNSAVLNFNGRGNLPQIQATIEDVEYEATLNDLVKVHGNPISEMLRKVAIRVHGMYCPHCPSRITSALNQEFSERVKIQKAMTVADPILKIEYLSQMSDFTIRHILLCLKNVDDAFKPSIHHSSTLEEISQKMQKRERTRILFHLDLFVVAVISTFIIGIVLMSLVPSTNEDCQFVLQSI